MVLFGQSAGSVSVDFYTYAYAQDPIIHGAIEQSGTAGVAFGPDSLPTPQIMTNVTEQPLSNWTNLVERVGCAGNFSGPDVMNSLPCMRSKPVDTILTASTPPSNLNPVAVWGPKFDNYTVYTDTSARVKILLRLTLISKTNTMVRRLLGVLQRSYVKSTSR